MLTISSLGENVLRPLLSGVTEGQVEAPQKHRVALFTRSDGK